jgi:hypothetical protein
MKGQAGNAAHLGSTTGISADMEREHVTLGNINTKVCRVP